MKLYIRNIFILALILMGLIYGFSYIISGLKLIPIFTLIGLFALNASLALWPIYRTKNRDPLKIYVGFMLPRIVFLSLILVYIVNQYGAEKVTFFITSLIAFVVFQGVEIAQLMNDRGILSHKK